MLAGIMLSFFAFSQHDSDALTKVQKSFSVFIQSDQFSETDLNLFFEFTTWTRAESVLDATLVITVRSSQIDYKHNEFTNSVDLSARPDCFKNTQALSTCILEAAPFHGFLLSNNSRDFTLLAPAILAQSRSQFLIYTQTLSLLGMGEVLEKTKESLPARILLKKTDSFPLLTFVSFASFQSVLTLQLFPHPLEKKNYLEKIQSEEEEHKKKLAKSKYESERKKHQEHNSKFSLIIGLGAGLELLAIENRKTGSVFAIDASYPMDWYFLQLGPRVSFDYLLENITDNNLMAEYQKTTRRLWLGVYAGRSLNKMTFFSEADVAFWLNKNIPSALESESFRELLQVNFGLSGFGFGLSNMRLEPYLKFGTLGFSRENDFRIYHSHSLSLGARIILRTL